jgi:hypothetical protein
MPATIENETTIETKNRLEAFDALGIDPKARFRFGKWKTFTVEWARKVEPSYLDWLSKQDWFVEGHSRMVTVDKPKPQRARRAKVAPAESVCNPSWPPSAAEQMRVGALTDEEWRPEQADHPKPLPRATRDVTIIAGGCVLVRPAAWAARATTRQARVGPA